MNSVSKAHKQAGIPWLKYTCRKLTLTTMDSFWYYLMTTCAITAMLSGVNPFDQPGVEAYKAEMRRLLEK